MTDDAWTVDHYLDAEIADRLGYLYWLIANKDVPKSKRAKEPKPLPRPADERKQRAKAEYHLQKARAFQAAMHI